MADIDPDSSEERGVGHQMAMQRKAAQVELLAVQTQLVVGFVRERDQLAKKLGWEPAEDELEFYYRGDEGPVHVTELWPVLMDQIDMLLAARSELRQENAGLRSECANLNMKLHNL